MNVLLAGGGTGGHLIPALALARELNRVRPDLDVVLVGAERGLEAQVLPRYPFRHHLLPIEPIYRHQWWRNLRWPLIAGRVWRAVGRVLEQEHPALVIGTGGYAAGPVVWRAQRRRLPTVLQEQNAFPGLTTRWLAHTARQIHLGFPEARSRLDPGRATQVFALGNPIQPPEAGDRSAVTRALGLNPDRPTVLVFGGSQGARALNEAVAGILRSGSAGPISSANLLWGVGSSHVEQWGSLAVPGRVVVRGFFDPMGEAYAAADLVVCRAGAMTTAELCAWGKASILVPLPTAAADHQSVNARALADAGAAVLLPEAQLDARVLATEIGILLSDTSRRATLSARARERGHPNAASEIVSKILTLVS
ncbi:MAG TPA: undecaprenyldiphospho-muramoylpentapeptide beta-N-acetylglucosaminyltransferase [Gemmatimonadales bacterium]|nr:undecaprenyldiphospho-muramoylpentapeptide beta-N-acetylglucosaminyltransferase [Gemmatimonadales bacterium]